MHRDLIMSLGTGCAHAALEVGPARELHQQELHREGGGVLPRSRSHRSARENAWNRLPFSAPSDLIGRLRSVSSRHSSALLTPGAIHSHTCAKTGFRFYAISRSRRWPRSTPVLRATGVARDERRDPGMRALSDNRPIRLLDLGAVRESGNQVSGWVCARALAGMLEMRTSGSSISTTRCMSGPTRLPMRGKITSADRIPCTCMQPLRCVRVCECMHCGWLARGRAAPARPTEKRERDQCAAHSHADAPCATTRAHWQRGTS